MGGSVRPDWQYGDMLYWCNNPNKAPDPNKAPEVMFVCWDDENNDYFTGAPIVRGTGTDVGWRRTERWRKVDASADR